MGSKKVTFEEFLSRANLLHNNVYDYSETKFVNSYTKLDIICPKHGKFSQRADQHMNRSGCRQCYFEERRLTIDQFIEKSNDAHQNKYDYSKSEYTGNRNDIIIICPEHGEFKQKAQHHMDGMGCIKCTHSEKMTNETYVIKAKKVHGDRYDYSRINYVNNTKPIEIICKIHGIFAQNANVHLWGCGCKKCYNSNRQLGYNTESFIDKCSEIHNNKFDYSELIYTGTLHRIKIICPTHGLFEQIASSHLSGAGCDKCSKDARKNNTITFIEKAKLKHNDIYNYSLVDYVGNHKSVKIICKKHGIFEQIASTHLQGHNCPKCSIENLSYTTEEFIERASKIHNYKYDYSLSNYVGSDNKIDIICKIHGLFSQIANSHIEGKGCRKCGGISRGKFHSENPSDWRHTTWHNDGLKSKNFTGFKVYVIKCWDEFETFYKIGKTFVNIEKRFAGSNMPYNYEILKTITDVDGVSLSKLENRKQKLHRAYRYEPIKKFGGRYECFSEIIDIENIFE
jgi:hypothetical protein